ncbi:MAG: hypothetical protein ROM54_05565 [Anaerobiospirillum sp.]|nr:hypothetical protein [Anaerobiospirillum sp.]
MTNDSPEPLAVPLSPNEQDSLRQAAEDAIFAGMAPTDAEMRLSDQYQALQQHDDLTESVLAHKDAYRARELGSNNLTSQQAAALIAEGRHMQTRTKAYFNYAQKARDQYLRRAQDHAFVAEIVQRVNGTSDHENEVPSSVDQSLPPTTAPQAYEAQDLAPSVQPVPNQRASEEQGSLAPHFKQANSSPDQTVPEDDEPQGGLGPNFQRAKRDALLGMAPSARRTNPVLSLLSINAPRHEHAAAEPTCAPAPADSDAPVALAPDLSGAAQFTAPAPEFDATAREASAASAPSSATTPSNLAGMANTTVDEPAQPAATTETAPGLDSEAGTQSYQATAPMPPDFAVLALDFESCRKLVAPVLAQVRATEDETLGQRYAHMREAAYSFYQLEEDIFGTGFDHGEQRTHLMLEFLAVLASQNQEDPFAVTQSDEWGRFAFLKRRNLILRQILFNNPELGIIAATTQQDEAKWQQWFEQFSAKLQSMTDGHTNQDNSAAAYHPEFLSALFAEIKHVCNEKFARLVTLVKVLRSWSIDTDKDRQWSTLFLFPFGYDSLFWEIVTSGAFKQNLMCGAGQNVFSMLARTRAQDTSDTLGPILVNRFLVNHNGLNTGAGFLSGSQLTQFPNELEVLEPRILSELQQASSCAERLERTNQRLKITVSATRYLPYRDLERYHLLREDFEALCRLDLTKQELFLALGSLGSLHQICYLLEQEKKVLALPGDGAHSCDLNMVVVANPEHKTGVRALSMRRLKENIALFAQARAHYVKAHLRAVVSACAPELLTKPLLTVTEQKQVCNLMRCAFDFNQRVNINLKEHEINDLPNTECITVVPDGISYAEIESVLIDHERRMHMESLHSTWSSDIGLTTKESAVSYFYSLSDELLYYLVLALVPKGHPIALKDFLTKLHQRYHLVIGLNDAGSYAVEDADFIANERQFKLKLARNHLLVSLSDACDYVRNPFSQAVERD